MSDRSGLPGHNLGTASSLREALDTYKPQSVVEREQQAEAQRTRDLDVGLGDYAKLVGKGAADLVSGVGFLSGQAADWIDENTLGTAGKIASLPFKGVSAVGELAGSASESLGESLSPDAQEAMSRSLVGESEDGSIKWGDGAGDIDVWAAKMAHGIGTMLPTLSTGGLSSVAVRGLVTKSMLKRGASKEVAEAVASKTAAKVGQTAAVGVGATGAVGGGAQEVYQTVNSTPFEDLMESDTFRQSVVELQKNPEYAQLDAQSLLGKAREITAERAAGQVSTDPASWAFGVGGALMGDRMLFKMLAGKAATKGVLGGMGKGAVAEGVSEAVQEGGQTWVNNNAMIDVAGADIDPMQGVVSRGLEGGLIGAGTGAGAGALGGTINKFRKGEQSAGGPTPDASQTSGFAPEAEPTTDAELPPTEITVEQSVSGQAEPEQSVQADPADPMVGKEIDLGGGRYRILAREEGGFYRMQDMQSGQELRIDGNRYFGKDGIARVLNNTGTEQPEVNAKTTTEPAPEAFDELNDRPAYERQGVEVEGADGARIFMTDKAAEPVADFAVEDADADPDAPAYLRAGVKVDSGEPIKEAKGKPKPAPEASSKEEVNAYINEMAKKIKRPEVQVPDPELTSQEEMSEMVDNFTKGINERKGVNWSESKEIETWQPNWRFGQQEEAQQAPAPVEGEYVPRNDARAVADSNYLEGPVQDGQSRQHLDEERGIGYNRAMNMPGLGGTDANPNYVPPLKERQDKSVEPQSIRDPRTDVGQAIQNAGNEADAIWQQLSSLRVTKRGKPFASEKEAAMASRKDEQPVPLPNGGFGVAKSAEVEQMQAQQTPAEPEQVATEEQVEATTLDGGEESAAVQPIAAARAEVNTEPTEAQKEAGNYKKGHVKLQGLDIALENPKGSKRSGTDGTGKAWEATMAHDYGYIKRTEGADGDHVDVFLGDNPDSQQVFVVNQVDPDTGKFDEHKVMLGFDSEQDARAGYLANYQADWKGLGDIQAMPVEGFKRWLKEGDTTKPLAGSVQPPAAPDPASEQSTTSQPPVNQAAELITEPEQKETARLLYKSSGDPFATEKSARISKVFKDNPGATIEPVNGGFAVRAAVQPEPQQQIDTETNPGDQQSQPDAAFRIEPTETSVRVYGEPETIRKTLRANGVSIPGAEVEGGLSFGKKLEDRIRQALNTKTESVAELASDVPAFSTRKGSKTKGEPLSATALRDTVNTFFHRYKGADDVSIEYHETSETLPGYNAERDRGAVIEGQYDFRTDTLHLVRTVFDKQNQVEAALREEILVHKGLGFFAPVDRQQLYRDIQQAAKENKEIGKLWDETVADYQEIASGHKLTTEEASRLYAEELLGSLAQRKVNWLQRGWNTLWRAIKRLLVKAGWAKPTIGEAELRSRIDLIAKAFEQGKRSRRRHMGADIRGQSDNIKFSQQSTISSKPAKGLTAKQAELGVKEWLKQYQGAGDIEVTVHATQAEFDKALGLEDGDRYIRRAAFDSDGQALHIAAENIDSPKRLREILRHEVLAHYGLQHALGFREYTQLITRVRASRNDKSMKAVWNWVDDNYPDATAGDKAEEVIAHLAELEPNQWRKGWDRVVDWVLTALRNVGFLPKGKISDSEIRRLLEGIGQKLGQGGPNDGGPRGGIRFSQTRDSALDKLNLGAKPDVIEKAKEKLQTLREIDRATATSWLNRTARKANTAMLDALAPIKYIENAIGINDADQSGYVAARLASGSSSTMMGALLHGIPQWKDGIVQRKAGTGEADALLGILQPLGKDLHNWLGWMAGHRAEILMAEGRENLLTADEIQALKDLGKGKEAQFNEAKAKWNTFNAAILDLAQEAGMVDPESRTNFESEWYIPFFRETDDGDVLAPFSSKGIANQRSMIKQLKGGTNKTNDLLENMFHVTSKTIDAAMKNHAARRTVENLMDSGIVEVIEKPTILDMRAKDKGQGVISFRHNGQEMFARVVDEDLFKAMTFLDRKPFDDPVTKVGISAKRLLTAMVTSSPEFMVRNFLRDMLSAWTINKDNYNPIDAFKGAVRAFKVDKNTMDMMFAGASFMGGYVNAQDPNAMADTVRKALRRKGMTPEQIAKYEKSIIRNAAQAKGVIADAWAKYQQYNEAAENGTREAVYEAAIKAGKSKAQAAFEAKDLMDFSMLGSARTLQWFVSVLPFFNARLQGLSKLGREFKENPAAIAKRGALLMAGSVALLTMNWDNEEYEALPDWDKDMNWHFWLGDQHFRIPKPFEVGVLFGTIPERAVRAMGGKDTSGEFGKVVARAMLETFAMNPVPQAINPMLEVYMNYDGFKGRAIENQYEQTLMPEARYDERTSQTMRELGDLTGLSPKQLEHLVNGYLGTMGAYGLMMSDWLVNAASDKGASPAKYWHERPIIKAIYRGDGSAPASSTKYIGQLYDMLDEVTTLHNTVNAYRKDNRLDDANALIKKDGDKLRSRSSLTSAQRTLRQIRNQMDLIRRDKTLTAEQKRDRINRLLVRRNDLAARVVQQNRHWFE